MRYIEGEDRSQKTLFPEMIDDYIGGDNPVRVIDAWVNKLDMYKLGFTYAEPKTTGRKPYDPRLLIKLYIYGYMRRIRTSRRLEAESHRNIELMWLLQKLKPDFKTIADFRKDNSKAIKLLVREFSLFCRNEGLLELDLICLDGSKFSAINHSSKLYTKNSLSNTIKNIDKEIDSYLADLDKSDLIEKDITKETKQQIEQTLEKLKDKKKELIDYQRILDEKGASQIALTDPDCRLMRTKGNGRDMCYNVQLAVDQKYKLIATYEVTNSENDLKQFAPMTQKLKDEFALDTFTAIADTGYFVKNDIKKAVDNGVDCYIAEQKNPTQKSRKNLYDNSKFFYDEDKDCYVCPAKQNLFPIEKAIKRNKSGMRYGTSSCKTCSLKEKCTKAKTGRKIFRWEHESLVETMRENLDKNREMMDIRRETAEHPFGIIKHVLGYSHFLCRGKEKVSTEMGLTVLGYNLIRAINIKGVPALLAILA